MNLLMRAGGRAEMIFFDWVALLLVVLPLVTGGFWIERPGLKLELTELAVPTLVVFALGYFSRTRLDRSWVLRKGRESFDRWRRFAAASPGFALAYGTVFVSLLWGFAALRRHWALQSNAFDLGIFTNAIWNLTHGFGYVSSVKGGINLFADHQSPIFWAFAPIFSVFPAPETLLIIQAIALASGAAAVYWLGRRYQSASSLLVPSLPLLYWCYLPVRRANLFDFHPEILMLPLFLWALVGILSTSRWKHVLGWTAFLAALLCKESAGPIAVGIGLGFQLGAAPDRKPRAFAGALAIAAGLATFIFDVSTVPRLAGAPYAYGSLYQHLSLGPLEWVRTVFAKSRFHFLFATLAPLGFLPFLAPRALVAALPAYAMLFLSAGDQRLSPQFHYGIEPAIGIFWALAVSASRLDSFRPPRFASKISLPMWILFWALFSFGRSELSLIRRFEPTEHARWIREQLTRCLSPDVSVTASSPLVPQLATRHWVQQVPDLGPVQAPNDCIIVDVDRSLNAWPLTAEERDHWQDGLASRGYQNFLSCGPTFVYQRQNFSGACLRCLPDCPKSH